jgi:hypothetical protein
MQQARDVRSNTKAAAADVPFLLLVLISVLTLSFGNAVLIFALLQ